MGENRLALLGGCLHSTIPDESQAPGAVDSILIVGDRIAAVDRRARVLELAGDTCPTIELAGRVVAPGFRDAHFHFYQMGLFLARPSLGACASRADALDVVRDAVREAPGDDPVLLEEWDESAWANPELPTRRDLDAIERDRPLVLRRVCGHIALFNGAALARLEDRGPVDDLARETGLVREGLVLEVDEIFEPGAAGARRALEHIDSRCLTWGITTATDFLRPEMAAVYRDHWGDTPRAVDLDTYAVEACFDVPGLLDSLPVGPDFRWRGLKLFLDGSVGGRTAAVSRDYEDRPGGRGALLYEDRDLRAAIGRAHAAGRAVAAHAIGDRAIAQALAAFGELPAGEAAARGHRIEHVELGRPADFDRLREIGVRPCMQPNFMGRWGGSGGLYEQALGPQRTEGMNALRTALGSGAGVFFGSDGMPPAPLFGIRSALHHPVPGQRLRLDEAIRLSTAAPADALPTTPGAGRLATGAPADIVVLPGSPEEIAAKPPASGFEEVDLTVKRGQVVHRRVAP